MREQLLFMNKYIKIYHKQVEHIHMKTLHIFCKSSMLFSYILLLFECVFYHIFISYIPLTLLLCFYLSVSTYLLHILRHCYQMIYSYLFFFICFCICIYLDITWNHDTFSIITIIISTIIPLFLIDRVLNICIFMFVLHRFGHYFFSLYKSYEIFIKDYIYLSVFILLGILLNIVLLYMKLKDIMSQEELCILSRIDPLTHVYNRRTGEQKVQQYLYQSHSSILCILDVDNFKLINDTWGHVIGDQILQEVTCILKKHIQKQDIIYRMGGDEFVVYMPYAYHEQELRDILEGIIRDISNLSYIYHSSILITMSIGVIYAYSSYQLYQLYKEADELLYLAKQTGKNQYMIKYLYEI